MITLDVQQNDLLERQRQYVQAINQFVWSQVGLWRRVPWWCLQADGRAGYLEKWNRCYHDKRYQVSQSMFVDCRFGTLVGWTGSPISNPQLYLEIAVDSLRADKLLAQLRTEAAKPVSPVIGQKVAGWRVAIAAERGICCAGC